jgi:urease accessory protein UreF
MLSILIFSGKQWSRAALAWLLFAVAVDGLARAGSEAAEAKLAAYNTAVALGVLSAAERLGPHGQYQVAKVEIVDLDLARLEPSAFGDLDDAHAPKP